MGLCIILAEKQKKKSELWGARVEVGWGGGWGESFFKSTTNSFGLSLARETCSEGLFFYQ